jgi:hypothetical protein
MQLLGISVAFFAALSFIPVSPAMAWYLPEPCDIGTRSVFVRYDTQHGTSEIFCSTTADPDGEPRRIARICHVSGPARLRLFDNKPIEQCRILEPGDCQLFCG